MDYRIVVVHTFFKRGTTDEAVRLLSRALELTRDEPGCLKAMLSRDVDDPDALVQIEQWKDKTSHDEHLKQPHIADLVETVVPLVAGVPRISVSESLAVADSEERAV